MNTINVVVDKSMFQSCPSLLDIESTLENIALGETIEIKWNNSRQEHATIECHKDRKFILYVPDIQASERAIASLELPLNINNSLVGDARIALVNKKLYNWREFSREKGATVTKHIILKMAADEIRMGNKPKLAYIAKDIFLDGVTPVNADTLLRIRYLRGY